MSAVQVPIWRARLVPRLGAGVEAEVARYVDRHLDQGGARFTRPHIQRLIDEARLRYTPDEVAAEVAANAEQRRVDIDTRSGAHLGLADLQACLELPDALDLEAALAQGAAQLKAAGSSEPLHVRRAQALGDLARSAQTPTPSTLPFPDPDHNDDNKTTGQDGNGQDGIGQDGSGREGSGRPRWGGGGVPRTGVKIYIHLNHTALRCTCTTPPEKTPKTPATGTALSSSAFDGAALPGTGPGTPASTATTGTAPSNPLLGGTALGEGLPGGSFVEYFIKGPGAGPGPGVTPAPEGPALGIYTPPAADPCGTAAPPVADPPGPSTASEASTPRDVSTARDASSGAGSDGVLMPDVAGAEERLGEVGRVDGTGMATAVLAPETIRGWFTRPRAFDCPGVKISVQQVLDPLEFISSQAYEVPQRARQATILTDRSCVFPYCHAIAERADCDHITPYDQGRSEERRVGNECGPWRGPHEQ